MRLKTYKMATPILLEFSLWRNEVCDGSFFCIFHALSFELKLFFRPEFPFKVTGDSLLIHVFAYSLFIGHCSVTSDMTGYSHSYHSIKLIHCSAPQRDVLSDKMVL